MLTNKSARILVRVVTQTVTSSPNYCHELKL